MYLAAHIKIYTNMNKIFLLIASAFLCLMNLSCNKANKGAAQETKIENKANLSSASQKNINFTEALGLSPKQEQQFESLREKYMTAMDGIRNDDEMDRDVLKNRIMKLRKEQLAEVEAMLDVEQFKTYKKLINARG